MLSHFLNSIPPWMLLVFGALAGGLRSMWSAVYDRTIGYVITKVTLSLRVEVTQHRLAYTWLSFWVEKRLGHRKVNSLLLRPLEKEHDDDDYHSTAKGSDYRLIPNYGTYYMIHQSGHPMVITHTVENAQQGGFTTAKRLHTFTFRLWGTRDRGLLLAILEEAKAEYESSLSRTVQHFRVNDQEWCSEHSLAPRPFESIYLPENLLSDILADIRTFLDNRKVYQDLSIPYRRGYQLEGPPGSGKSSLILAIAAHFHLPVYSVSLHRISAQGLLRLLSQCARPSIVVFEDVDCIKAASVRQSSEEDSLTMSDFLNAVDGVGASENRLMFMTTNHPHSIDPALMRAGRIDRRFHLTYAEDRELRRFHARVGEKFNLLPWKEFRAGLPEKATIADAQAFAFRNSQ